MFEADAIGRPALVVAHVYLQAGESQHGLLPKRLHRLQPLTTGSRHPLPLPPPSPALTICFRDPVPDFHDDQLEGDLRWGIDEPHIDYKDTLSKSYTEEAEYDIVMANPPFTGSIDKGDINEALSLSTTKTELLFVENIYRLLKKGGTACVIVPQGVLFGSGGAFKTLRKILIERCELKRSGPSFTLDTVRELQAARPGAEWFLIIGQDQFANLINVLVGGCPAEECSDAPTVIKPSGMRDMIDIAASYGIPLWITENGLADAADTQRPSYLVRHLAVVNKAITDGVDIRGYISWSLLDNLEWILGYGEKFGLYSWDPVTLERTARSTVAVLNQITTTNSIPAELFQQYVKATGSLT